MLQLGFPSLTVTGIVSLERVVQADILRGCVGRGLHVLQGSAHTGWIFTFAGTGAGVRTTSARELQAFLFHFYFNERGAPPQTVL